jgi:hypothetical protein
MPTTVTVRLALLAAAMLALPSAAGAQQSRCADCHFVNAPQGLSIPAGDALRHLRDWDLSAHARKGIVSEGARSPVPVVPSRRSSRK